MEVILSSLASIAFQTILNKDFIVQKSTSGRELEDTAILEQGRVQSGQIQ